MQALKQYSLGSIYVSLALFNVALNSRKTLRLWNTQSSYLLFRQ